MRNYLKEPMPIREIARDHCKDKLHTTDDRIVDFVATRSALVTAIIEDKFAIGYVDNLPANCNPMRYDAYHMGMQFGDHFVLYGDRKYFIFCHLPTGERVKVQWWDADKQPTFPELVEPVGECLSGSRFFHLQPATDPGVDWKKVDPYQGPHEGFRLITEVAKHPHTGADIWVKDRQNGGQMQKRLPWVAFFEHEPVAGVQRTTAWVCGRGIGLEITHAI